MKKSIRKLDKEEYVYYRRLKKEVFNLRNIKSINNKTLQYVNALYNKCVKWNYYYPNCLIKLTPFTDWVVKNNLQRFNLYTKGFSVEGKTVLQFRTVEVKKVARD